MKVLQITKNLFSRNYSRYNGVRPIQVYLLRLVFILTFLFVGMDSWSEIIRHQGDWNNMNAVAFSVWAAYSSLALLGILKPLKMLPVMAFQILYKVIWLTIVAYPLWANGTLESSPAAGMTKAFLWVILPIVAMPWGYFFRMFFQKTNTTANPVVAMDVK
ncbi:MAG TPA: hypothetical protein VIM75_01415 [Ohtaekwangia sp.]|uniref:hypothetical protein n=1 Tax=Ohtaekwangia sp. TaxID=2066019 RepID=UPI002F948929